MHAMCDIITDGDRRSAQCSDARHMFFQYTKAMGNPPLGTVTKMDPADPRTIAAITPDDGTEGPASSVYHMWSSINKRRDWRPAWASRASVSCSRDAGRARTVWVCLTLGTLAPRPGMDLMADSSLRPLALVNERKRT